MPATAATSTLPPLLVLAEGDWLERRRAHEARVRAWTDPHQERAARGEKHPVFDFLFSYYAFRAAWLRRWHPGPGVVLAGARAREFLRWTEYREVPLEDGTMGVSIRAGALTPTRRDFVRWLHDLLEATAQRPAFFGCFGLHEWAMVYRQEPNAARHAEWPLRFSSAEIARIVEAGPVRCTHFDAFRFFTPEARPLNRVQPTRDTVPLYEQRGCLHAGMDLYKWAFKLAPFTPAECLADCFALARDIREVDMRASPYDLAALGFPAIRIESPAGRDEYEMHQRAFAARGEPLRERLRALCEHLLQAAPADAELPHS